MASDSCDELPSLDDIFSFQRNAGFTSNLRRSPRKNVSTASDQSQATQCDLSIRKTAPKQIRSPPRRPLVALAQPKTISDVGARSVLMDNIPILPRNGVCSTEFATSNNRSSPGNTYRPTRLPHVDSLLLPLSKLAIEQQDPGKDKHASAARGPLLPRGKSVMFLMTEVARSSQNTTTSPRRAKPVPSYANQYVLKEARCNDDDEDSTEEEEEEDTDLSGFIVDDDAELSFHESSASDLEDERSQRRKQKPLPRLQRRLQRGSRTDRLSKSVDDATQSEGDGKGDDNLMGALRKLSVGGQRSKHRENTQIEVIDLSSSPQRSTEAMFDPFDTPKKGTLLNTGSNSSSVIGDDDPVLRFSPPHLKSPLKVPDRPEIQQSIFTMETDDPVADARSQRPHAFITPPVTPPRSPSKLKSPSKLLSPSKRNDPIPRSPHRQSMDAFWDLHAINEWTDQYSPKKAPVASPRKQGLGRFKIWSDSEDEAGDDLENSGSLPSPCSSPRKSKSPLKSPEKTEKKRIAEEKKALAARKRAFEESREKLASDLLHELDTQITGSQLSKLAASTGGVQVIWSKTLRSTAGRANWRRTVTKLSGSPMKGAVAEGPDIKVQHFANIELAEKVIDCEDRLVNTLAHEFCHLANFMVSGIRDQPHGTSFKNWAAKVTKHLRSHDNTIWRKVEVTTKHSYAINHKYLWACVGRETSKAMEFLNLEDDEGCGAEYGRHSKSIDTEKQRCGRCKGKLVQVRPKPRASPVKKDVRPALRTEGRDSSGSGSVGELEKMVEVVELSD